MSHDHVVKYPKNDAAPSANGTSANNRNVRKHYMQSVQASPAGIQLIPTPGQRDKLISLAPLNKRDKAVLRAHAAHLNQYTGVAWPSIGKIAAACSFSHRSVSASRTYLVQSGFLDIIRHGGGRSPTTYSINWDKLGWKPEHISGAASAAGAQRNSYPSPLHFPTGSPAPIAPKPDHESLKGNQSPSPSSPMGMRAAPEVDASNQQPKSLANLRDSLEALREIGISLQKAMELATRFTRAEVMRARGIVRKHCRDKDQHHYPGRVVRHLESMRFLPPELRDHPPTRPAA